MSQFFFKKNFRLSSISKFYTFYSKSYRIYTSEFILLQQVNNLNYPRLGISISKHNINKAYNRNRIKRIIRESFRLLQYKLRVMDFLIVVKKTVCCMNNQFILRCLKNLWTYK